MTEQKIGSNNVNNDQKRGQKKGQKNMQKFIWHYVRIGFVNFSKFSIFGDLEIEKKMKDLLSSPSRGNKPELVEFIASVARRR